MAQTEREIRANKPVHLFTVGGKAYNVPILAINKADDWLAQTDILEVLEQEIQDNLSDRKAKREAMRKFSAAISDLVFCYDPSLKREELEDKVNPAQMVDAYYRLKALTDPFENAQETVMEAVTKRLRGLPQNALRTLGDIPKQQD